MASSMNWAAQEVLDSFHNSFFVSVHNLDTLGIEPRASRMLCGCDTTTPRAPWKRSNLCILIESCISELTDQSVNYAINGSGPQSLNQLIN